MKDYVVRVVLPDGVHELTPLLRTFIHFLDKAGAVVIQRDDVEGMCFDLLPPAGITDARVWAASVTMYDEYGFNAVPAPACPRE